MADLVITNVQQHEGKNDDTNNTKKRKLITIPLFTPYVQRAERYPL